jgi:hypothetical protein
MMFRYFGIICLVAVLFLTSCSPGRNLARAYVKNHTGSGIMIIPLYELLKDNLTINYDTAVQFSDDQFDSIAWVQSLFIQHVSDSVFLTTFTNSMIDELSQAGFDVYVDGSSDIFLSLPDPKWMVQIAQLQLNEEHRIEYREVFTLGKGEPSYVGFRINQVNLNSWIEVSRANTGNKQMLYLEGYIQDNFHMGLDFDLLEGSVGLLANRDSLVMDNVYMMAEQSGRKHAELLFDYFMNDYIRVNLPPGILHREYFHYDLKAKSLKRGLTERFDVVH